MAVNISRVAASSTIFPAYITSTRSVRPAMTPMSWVMRTTAIPSCWRRLVDEVEDLGLDGDVEGGGGLVGDEQLRLAGQRHGDHHPLAQAAGELVGVGVEALPGPGHVDQGEDLERPLAGLGLRGARGAGARSRRSGGRWSWWD